VDGKCYNPLENISNNIGNVIGGNAHGKHLQPQVIELDFGNLKKNEKKT